MFPQLFTPAVKNHLDLLVTLYTDLAQRMLETMQSLSELNMQFARDLIAEAGANTQRLMSGKLLDPNRPGTGQQRAAKLPAPPGRTRRPRQLQHGADGGHPRPGRAARRQRRRPRNDAARLGAGLRANVQVPGRQPDRH